MMALTTAMMSCCVSFSISNVRSRVTRPEDTASRASMAASAGAKPHSPRASRSAISTLCSNSNLCAREKTLVKGVEYREDQSSPTFTLDMMV